MTGDLTDRRPLAFEGRFLWHPQPEGADRNDQYDYLPPAVFLRLDGYIERGTEPAKRVRAYPTWGAAVAALERAVEVKPL
jgi:hypothetical protein